MSGKLFFINENVVKSIRNYANGKGLVKNLVDPNFVAPTFTKMNYSLAESNWFVGMRNAYLDGFITGDKLNAHPEVDKYGHTGFTFSHTKKVVDNVSLIGLPVFEKKCVHLNYDTKFRIAMCSGINYLNYVFSNFLFEEDVAKELQKSVDNILLSTDITEFIKIMETLKKHELLVAVN